MTKAFRLSFMFLIIFSSSLFAVEVDVEEIRTRRVEFINYRGPQGRADSIKAINAIGEGLAAGARKAESNRIIRYHEKYSIVRAISESEPEKYSADIISIDRKAMVTHIANVRRITAAYLRDMYGYSESEAAALALFVSYYNAIHRGDMPYFRSKYKDVVLKRINAGNAGIARIYSQWPGKTRLIIPLTEQSKRGEIGRIDPFVIGDEKTRQMVRKERNTIDERKEMSGLKEKKISDDRKEIEERKREQAKTGEIIKTEEKKIEKEKEDLDKKRRDLEKKEEQTAREKEEIKKIPDPEKRRQKEREAEERKKQVETEKEKIRNEEDGRQKAGRDRYEKKGRADRREK